MSGQKTSYVRIEEREARRLREMETHFRAVQSDLPERLRQLKNEMQTQSERQRQRTEARLKEFEKVTNNLKSDLAESERRQQQRLRDGLAKVRSEMSDQIGGERAAREEQARRMRQEYRTLIDNERAERQQQFKALDDRLGSIENREQKIAQLSADALEDLKMIMAEVDKLQHERFAPGKFHKLSIRAAQAEENLKIGASEAALGTAQDCYLDLIEVRADVLYQEQVFEQAFLEAMQAIKNLLAEVDAYQEGTVYPNAANEFNFKVDFWSGGKMSKITSEIKEIEQRLENEKDVLSIDQVRALEKDVGGLRGQMLAAVESAKVAIVNSQACYNVSQVVEDVLIAQGYEVADGVYEGEDQRRAYGLKMKNRGGDEVVTIITPSPDRELEYQMQMNFFDRSQDEAMRRDFARAVQTGLHNAGVETPTVETTRDVAEPDESVRDFETFRERRTSVEQAR